MLFVSQKSSKQQEEEDARTNYLAIPKTVSTWTFTELSYPHNPLQFNFQFSVADYVFCSQLITVSVAESSLPMTQSTSKVPSPHCPAFPEPQDLSDRADSGTVPIYLPQSDSETAET